MNDYPLSLKVEGSAGSDIADCFDHALKIAVHVGINVTFDFNGVFCGVRPSDIQQPQSREWFLANFHRELSKHGKTIRICYANP